MKPARRKRNIPMYAAGVLLCLTLLTTHIVSWLYARYITVGSAVDAARTAAFYLEAEGTLMQYVQSDIIPGTPQQKTLKIVNHSEVAMEYCLTVRRETSNLPLDVTLTGSEMIQELNGTFSVTATLNPGEQTDVYTLTLQWEASETEPDPNLAYMGMLDYFTVTVDAAQVD